jgi:ketosteroid isomerase-like protein
MLLALVLQAAAPQTAVEAERAFNAAAQARGQWTAFREFAAKDAIVFMPQPERAETALPTKNPPIAVQWWPAKSYISCDGTTAINTGSWVRPKSVGYFTTVWRKQTDGQWKWELDAGDALAKPRPLPAKPEIVRASCAPMGPVFSSILVTPGAKTGDGKSADGTLNWHWQVTDAGERIFEAWLWDGKKVVSIIADQEPDDE